MCGEKSTTKNVQDLQATSTLSKSYSHRKITVGLNNSTSHKSSPFCSLHTGEEELPLSVVVVVVHIF